MVVLSSHVVSLYFSLRLFVSSSVDDEGVQTDQEADNFFSIMVYEGVQVYQEAENCQDITKEDTLNKTTRVENSKAIIVYDKLSG